MKETKVQLNERKIRNAQRHGAVKAERKAKRRVWQKLTAVPKKKRTSEYNLQFGTAGTGKSFYYGASTRHMRGTAFDTVVIDELVK